ncbi:MAG: DedA family protein [Terriglobales bacterium]
MLAGIGQHIIALIAHLGYAGVVLLMILEAACIPVPSEVILTFSGFLVSTGRLELVAAGLAAAIGNSIGSMIAYTVGYYGGPPVAHRYGRWLLIAPGDLTRAEAWFRKRGDITVFICRMLPVVRTYIALPAGVARMPVVRFNLYTFIGSLPWCFALLFVGDRLGQHWQAVAPWFHQFDAIWAPVVAVLIALAVWHHVRRFRREVKKEGVKVI